MSAFGLLELQKAILAKLTGDTALMALAEGVYDRVPVHASFPYIAIGDASADDWSGVEVNGVETRADIQVYSRQGGRKEALTLMKRVYELLHDGSLTVTGHVLVQIRMERADIRQLTDGATYRGMLRFRILSEEAV